MWVGGGTGGINNETSVDIWGQSRDVLPVAGLHCIPPSSLVIHRVQAHYYSNFE